MIKIFIILYLINLIRCCNIYKCSIYNNYSSIEIINSNLNIDEGYICVNYNIAKFKINNKICIKEEVINSSEKICETNNLLYCKNGWSYFVTDIYNIIIDKNMCIKENNIGICKDKLN
jgi:hypothetical protein